MKTRQRLRQRRKISIRKKLRGTVLRPRLVVFRSNKKLYAQIIDDDAQKTLASASASADTIGVAEKFGKEVAAKIKKLNVDSVVFDRGGFRYHGVVKSFADSVRGEGIGF